MLLLFLCTDSFPSITISAIDTGLSLILLLLILTAMIAIVCVAMNKNKNRGIRMIRIQSQTFFPLGVIDHVPVDDNPAYITMKRITLNKNTAYETVNINEAINTGAVYETVL